MGVGKPKSIMEIVIVYSMAVVIYVMWWLAYLLYPLLMLIEYGLELGESFFENRKNEQTTRLSRTGDSVAVLPADHLGLPVAGSSVSV